jgi:hypothetical protein
VTVRSSVLYDKIPCRLVEIYWCFRLRYHFYIQGRNVCLFAQLTLQPCTQIRFIPLRRLSSFTGLHSSTTQITVLLLIMKFLKMSFSTQISSIIRISVVLIEYKTSFLTLQHKGMWHTCSNNMLPYGTFMSPINQISSIYKFLDYKQHFLLLRWLQIEYTAHHVQ